MQIWQTFRTKFSSIIRIHDPAALFIVGKFRLNITICFTTFIGVLFAFCGARIRLRLERDNGFCVWCGWSRYEESSQATFDLSIECRKAAVLASKKNYPNDVPRRSGSLEPQLTSWRIAYTKGLYHHPRNVAGNRVQAIGHLWFNACVVWQSTTHQSAFEKKYRTISVL